ncbi:hypothetical protein [Synechococcus sp. UW105]|uniref:hypothetical protein n=1 Tax=Synechococcus sp. UW105 TaxID=337067 RepID=UPI000E0EF48D|nr:hypothetical protein [Synechococcus sp. UW105]
MPEGVWLAWPLHLIRASAIAIAPLPFRPQDGSAEDLWLMSISIKAVVKPQVGLLGILQGAATPKQAGIAGLFRHGAVMATR